MNSIPTESALRAPHEANAQDPSQKYIHPKVMLFIYVGDAENKQRFMVPMNMTPFIQTTFSNLLATSSPLNMCMPDILPSTFKMLSNWYYKKTINVNEEHEHSLLVTLAQLWVLAARLEIPRLQNEIMNTMWHHVGFNYTIRDNPTCYAPPGAGHMYAYHPLTQEKYDMGFVPHYESENYEDAHEEDFCNLKHYIDGLKDDKYIPLAIFWDILDRAIKYWARETFLKSVDNGTPGGGAWFHEGGGIYNHFMPWRLVYKEEMYERSAYDRLTSLTAREDDDKYEMSGECICVCLVEDEDEEEEGEVYCDRDHDDDGEDDFKENMKSPVRKRKRRAATDNADGGFTGDSDE